MPVGEVVFVSVFVSFIAVVVGVATKVGAGTTDDLTRVSSPLLMKPLKMDFLDVVSGKPDAITVIFISPFLSF